jgi:hypothetical protein
LIHGSARDFSLLYSVQTLRPALRLTQPLIQWVLWAPSPGVKHQGREADHSPPSSAEIENGKTILNSSIRLHGVTFNELNIGTTLHFFTL